MNIAYFLLDFGMKEKESNYCENTVTKRQNTNPVWESFKRPNENNKKMNIKKKDMEIWKRMKRTALQSDTEVL